LTPTGGGRPRDGENPERQLLGVLSFPGNYGKHLRAVGSSLARADCVAPAL